MRKTIFVQLLLLASYVVPMWAQQTGPQLVVWQKSGEKVYYQLGDLPETTFENGLLVIKCQGQTAVQYQLENILRYTYENVASVIDLQPNERSVSINRQGDAVTLQNLPAGTAVILYAANGAEVATAVAQSGQPLTISVGQRPAGVYLVKVGSQTIKLLKP